LVARARQAPPVAACTGFLVPLKCGVMKLRRLALLIGLLFAGCVGMDTWGVRSQGSLPAEGLSSEQAQQLRSAAAMGEPSLIATAGRMAWENPENSVQLANYAANLFPDREQEIRAAVLRGVAR
jgi:hypothetical protein